MEKKLFLLFCFTHFLLNVTGYYRFCKRDSCNPQHPAVRLHSSAPPCSDGSEGEFVLNNLELGAVAFSAWMDVEGLTYKWRFPPRINVKDINVTFYHLDNKKKVAFPLQGCCNIPLTIQDSCIAVKCEHSVQKSLIRGESFYYHKRRMPKCDKHEAENPATEINPANGMEKAKITYIALRVVCSFVVVIAIILLVWCKNKYAKKTAQKRKNIAGVTNRADLVEDVTAATNTKDHLKDASVMSVFTVENHSVRFY